MTDRFRRKVRSQRGASLLLALLFLLICAMVGASILMAAAANAGKHRSNLDEHQTYLALSSAVSLLCDELAQAEYRGQYSYWEETKTQTVNGEEVSVTTRHFKWQSGVYTSALSGVLLANFDAIFYQKAINQLNEGIQNHSENPPTDVLPSEFVHTLTVTPETGTVMDTPPVTVELRLDTATYATYLTATLENYTIRAELTPTATNVPALPTSLINQGSNTVQKTDPMQWKIGWITTGEEEGDGP